ncbi:MAG: glycosyltransferase family 2 protein, partial [Candidatus Altiarchaeota archaeon]|nr:glycosyltransferase family 2 protein [Candidatus Altiarchaeota archaeon]
MAPSNKPKVTVICTLKNEILGLDILMSSLLNQTTKPNEIVVVDGGSTDGTLERLKEWIEIFSKIKVKMKVLQEKGANIARGRNLAIEAASSEFIASIDGGCVAKRLWLEK